MRAATESLAVVGTVLVQRRVAGDLYGLAWFAYSMVYSLRFLVVLRVLILPAGFRNAGLDFLTFNVIADQD